MTCKIMPYIYEKVHTRSQVVTGIELCCGVQLACFLVSAWDVLAEFEEKTIWDFPVEFLDVAVYQPVRVERTDKVVLGVLFDFKSRFQVQSQSAKQKIRISLHCMKVVKWI